MTDWHKAADALTAQPLFQSVSTSDLARFLSRIEILDFDHDEALHVADVEAEYSYFVLECRLDVAGISGGHSEIREGFLGEEAAIGLDTYLAKAGSEMWGNEMIHEGALF